MSQTLTLSRPREPASLPVAPVAAVGAGDSVFYPLLLIAEQALRDTSGHLSLGTFWQVMESRRFIGALLNTLQIAVLPRLAVWCWAA